MSARHTKEYTVNIKGLKYNGGSLRGTFPVPKNCSLRDLKIKKVYLFIDSVHAH